MTGIQVGRDNINNGTQIGQQNLVQNVLPEDIEGKPKEALNLKPLPLFDIDDGVIYALSDDEENEIIRRAKESTNFISEDSRAFGVQMVYPITGITATPINAGDVLIFEPQILPRNGDLVLLCLGYPDKMRGIVARLSVDIHGVMSVQHSDHAPEPLPKGSIICGVVRKIEREYLDGGIVRSRLDNNYNPLATLVE